jgi:hypothetical protein
MPTYVPVCCFRDNVSCREPQFNQHQQHLQELFTLSQIIQNNEICALLRYYTALSGSSVLTFQDNLTASPSRVNLKIEATGCPETSVKNYHSTLWHIP